MLEPPPKNQFLKEKNRKHGANMLSQLADTLSLLIGKGAIRKPVLSKALTRLNHESRLKSEKGTFSPDGYIDKLNEKRSAEDFARWVEGLTFNTDSTFANAMLGFFVYGTQEDQSKMENVSNQKINYRLVKENEWKSVQGLEKRGNNFVWKEYKEGKKIFVKEYTKHNISYPIPNLLKYKQLLYNNTISKKDHTLMMTKMYEYLLNENEETINDNQEKARIFNENKEVGFLHFKVSLT